MTLRGQETGTRIASICAEGEGGDYQCKFLEIKGGANLDSNPRLELTHLISSMERTLRQTQYSTARHDDNIVPSNTGTE